MNQPIALTSGDPSGVGLEISGKAWAALKADVPFFLIADPDHVSQATDVPVTVITSPEQACDAAKTALPVLPLSFPAKPLIGAETPQNAAAIIASIEQAVGFVQSGQAVAVCTNPINKKVLKDGADFAHPGHTEFLAYLGGVEASVMMLCAPELKAVPTTIHIALADVPTALTPELIRYTITTTHRALLRDFGVNVPVIAVAGLNPHAGEGGNMGREELDYIAAALDDLRATGIEILGPLPADTMFHPQARARYDAAVCMYHDQALIPLKTLNFSAGVNTTLGLPFIRTSPDHGTAFDIAGRGIADPNSLIEALKQASDMAENRAQYDAFH